LQKKDKLPLKTYWFLAAVPGMSTDIKELNNCLIFCRGCLGTRLNLVLGIPVNDRPFPPGLFFGLFMAYHFSQSCGWKKRSYA